MTRVLCAFLVFVLGFWGCEKDKEAPAASKSDLVTVQVPQAPQRVMIGPVPPITVLPDGTRDVSSRLRWLIEAHPSPQIRIDMVREAEAGRLQVMMGDPVPGFIAEFRPATRQTTGEDIGTMLFNPQAIDEMGSEDDAFYAMVIIYHEFQHYRQFMRATLSEKELWRFDVQTSDQIPTEWCVQQWRNEYEAYLVEVEFARQSGAVAQDAFLTDTSFVGANLLKIFREAPAYRRSYPQCEAVWMREAGL